MSRTDFIFNRIKSRSYTDELNSAFMKKMQKAGMLLYSTDEKGRRYLSEADKQLSNVIKNKSTEYYKEKLAKRNSRDR